MSSIAHRGPDDKGHFQEGAVSMGFVRLAIIDLSPGGHQPMTSVCGDHVIVFNGEIYNYRELRAEMQAAGLRFASGSDTEVLLAAYRHWGERCLERLNGMFAFLILNRRDGSVFGARDRLGEKPMYWWQDDQWTVLASEPRALAATGLIALRPDWSRFADLVFGGEMDHAGGTCLDRVRQVPAAHAIRIDPRGSLRCHAYWTVPAGPDADADADADERRSDADLLSELSELVADAVRLRLRSDVPLGFTLSGGIDSSLLICEAAQQGSGELDAFVYQDRLYDERRLIEQTVARTGARQHVVEAEALDVAALLPRVVEANGEPVHSLSAVANYALFARARERGTKVLLGGQGADEVFLGYRSFERDRWHAMAVAGHWAALLSDMRGSADVHERRLAPLLKDVAARALRFALARSKSYRWLRSTHQKISPPRPRCAIFSPEFWRPHAAARGAWFEAARLSDFQRQALTNGPLPLYLRIEDRVSMAHSIEARLPFTDHRLVEYGVRLADRLKFAGGINKVALRKVAARRVPAAVTSTVRKLGFPVGHSERSARGLHALCRELAATRAFRERGLYDRRAVDALLSRAPVPADVDLLFELAQVELWLTGLASETPPK